MVCIETSCFNLFFLCYNSITHIVVGQGMGEGKAALYHCNYCHKNISGKIRTKCVVCPDFDLCIECFSIGAEVTPHVCFHPYRVMVCKLIQFGFFLYYFHIGFFYITILDGLLMTTHYGFQYGAST